MAKKTVPKKNVFERMVAKPLNLWTENEIGAFLVGLVSVRSQLLNTLHKSEMLTERYWGEIARRTDLKKPKKKKKK